MKDIVERLRNWTIMPAASPASDIMDEAADEIERLRADWPEQLTAHKVLITEQELEIARLRLRLSAKGDCPEPENETKQDIPPLLSRAGTNGETAGEHAAKCTVASAKLPERERVANHLEKPDSSTLTDAEREAVERAADLIDAKTCGDSATLRALLERLGGDR